eukprot:UC4_evm3s285
MAFFATVETFLLETSFRFCSILLLWNVKPGNDCMARPRRGPRPCPNNSLFVTITIASLGTMAAICSTCALLFFSLC